MILIALAAQCLNCNQVSPTNAYEKDVCSELDDPPACVVIVRRNYQRCGPAGTVGLMTDPHPRCRRRGWNGYRYLRRHKDGA